LTADFDDMLDGILTELVNGEPEETQEPETDAAGDGDVETDSEGAEPELEDEGDSDPVEDSEDELETSDEDGDDNEAEAIVELDPEMTVRIDGKDVKVSEALELKADYTRKTQALSEERKAFEAEREEVAERVQYLSELERAWSEEPSGLLASFAAASDDTEELLAQTVVTLARANAADGNLAVVKAVIALAADDLLDDGLAEQFGFTEDVIDRIKRQVKSEERVVKLERRLAAEDQKRSAVEQETQTKAQFEAEVSKHLSELNSQWERIVSANPEVASMSDVERAQLRVELVEFARENDGVPLNVAFEALEARRLRDDRAKRAATAASRQKKASASRVTSRPSGTASAPAPRAKGDWDAAIAEAVAELEARKARN
jgi:hypothetical protein